MVRRWLRDREVPGSNSVLTTGISLSKKCIPHLLLSTQVYKRVPVSRAVAAYCTKKWTTYDPGQKCKAPLNAHLECEKGAI